MKRVVTASPTGGFMDLTANEREAIFTKLRGIVGCQTRDLDIVFSEIEEVLDKHFKKRRKKTTRKQTGGHDRMSPAAHNRGG